MGQLEKLLVVEDSRFAERGRHAEEADRTKLRLFVAAAALIAWEGDLALGQHRHESDLVCAVDDLQGALAAAERAVD